MDRLDVTAEHGRRPPAPPIRLHKTGAQPLYAFGHRLGYTDFEYRDLKLEGGEGLTAFFTIANTGG